MSKLVITVIASIGLASSWGNAIIFREEDKKEAPLVIPLLGSKAWHDRIINKIDADIFESKAADKDDTRVIKIKVEPQEVSNGDIASMNKDVVDASIKMEPSDEQESKVLTLEEEAAKEIIEDVKSMEIKEVKMGNLTLPLREGDNLRGVEEVGIFIVIV